jgi:hypothetical protein
MEISPAFVGTRLKDYRCVITWRQSMNYAAAVNESTRGISTMSAPAAS